MRSALAAGLVALSLVSSSWALAQDRLPPDALGRPDDAPRDDEARSLFDAGATAYAAGHYADAEGHFRRAYEISGRAALLHNIGTAAERANHDRAALEAYRRYLELEPESERRARVEVRIRALEAATAATDVDPAAWILVGVSSAVLVAGVVMVGASAADVATVEAAPMLSRWEDVRDAYDRSLPLSIAGFVSLGVGVAGIAAGVAWALIGSGPSPELALRVSPQGLMLGGSFQ